MVTDAVRWDTNVATELYGFFWAGVPVPLLRLLSLQMIETVTEPVLGSTLGVFEGGPAEPPSRRSPPPGPCSRGWAGRRAGGRRGSRR